MWSLPTEVFAAVSWHGRTQTAVVTSVHPDLIEDERKSFLKKTKHVVGP